MTDSGPARFAPRMGQQSIEGLVGVYLMETITSLIERWNTDEIPTRPTNYGVLGL